MAKILFIIANTGYQDTEFGVTHKILTAQGHECTISSGKGGRCLGVFGDTVESTYKIADINAKDYDLIIFIGGGGAFEQYFGDNTYLKIAKQGKSIAAICIAPTIISYSGILNGKEVTGRDDGQGTQIKQIEKNGGIFKNEEVVQDGKIITANGPAAATKFARKIVDYLKN